MHPIVAYQNLAQRTVVGLMSGTSADGIDVAVVEIGATVALRSFRTVPLPDDVRTVLFEVFAGRGEVRDAPRLDALLGEVFADAALSVSAGAHLIASHGQTLYHQPEASVFGGRPIRCTWQAGDGCILAARTGLPVVSDFRVADMAMGGQGAPLVPYADSRLFTDPIRYRVILNIGGIANLTWLPAAGREPVRAFDTGPGNALLDAAISMRTNGTHRYDSDGRLAAAGHVQDSLLTSLLQHPYLSQQGPRSTGREAFGVPMAEQVVTEQGNLATADLLATLCAFTARSIAQGLRELPRIDEVYVGGGGAHNDTLLTMLGQDLPGVPVRKLEVLGVPADAREAIAFAIMGDATMRNIPSNVPTATGARGPAVLGKISLPPF